MVIGISDELQGSTSSFTKISKSRKGMAYNVLNYDFNYNREFWLQYWFKHIKTFIFYQKKPPCIDKKTSFCVRTHYICVIKM